MADSDDSKHLYSTTDRSSLSNPSEAVSTNIKLEWDIDFDKQTITGSVEHVVKVVTNGATHVDFDSAKINIIGDVLVNGEKGTYSAAPAHEVLGTKLSVEIPASLRSEGTHFTVRFNYFINTDASAMQWLPASATKGLKYPYLFTQSQAIHARSLMPCQDSPGIKTEYTARVTAPKWCTVLMSALADTDKVTEGEKNVFVWKQPNPTPAYLVALAAGNLESREISHRVRVWAEPEVVESALFEFSETEDFVQAAEELTGCPYQWQRYDILCLPPSFPYGGMENPCLTFATPTLLAGDKSLADVIAHEIAHSWTGNLVTNHTWDHFWLNEGWTVWLERKITAKVRKNEEFGRLSSQVGWKHLQDDVKLLGETNPFTALTWKLAFGEDPDNAYSGVPYEKGANLLMYLEEVVGTELFSQFVFSYIDTFKFNTVTTGAFRDHFVSFFDKLAASEAETNATPTKSSNKKKKNKNKNNNNNKDKDNKDKEDGPSAAAANAVQAIKGLDWNSLFYSTGLPTDVTSFSNSLSKAAEELARKWIALSATYKTDAPPAGCAASDLEGWSTMQKNVFLETLQNYTKKSLSHPSDVFTVAFLELMDRTYAFGASKNAEIMLRWQTLCLESEASWIVDPVVDFITSQGRMKFARPLYRLLRASTIGKQIAIDTFEAKKDIYHPIARKMIAADLRRAAEAEEKEAIESQLEAEAELSATVAKADTPVVTTVETDSEDEAEIVVQEVVQEKKAIEEVPVPEKEEEEIVVEAESAPVFAVGTPEATSKGLPDQTPAPMGSPERSITPDFSTPAATPTVTPAATPAKIATPVAPAPTPVAKEATPVATPVVTPAKEATPQATPVATPAAKKATPVASPVVTPAKEPTPQATPVATPAVKEATPAPTPIATPAKVTTPAANPVGTPAAKETTPAPTPIATPAKVTTPAATPVATLAAKEPTPAPTPVKETTPVKTVPVAAPAPAPVVAAASTPAAPAASSSPAKKEEAAPQRRPVANSASQEVSTFSWSGVSIFVALAGAVGLGAFFFTRRFRR